MRTIYLYYLQHRKAYSLTDAWSELRTRKQFHVFISFLDPRTDSYVSQSFLFYSKPVTIFTDFRHAFLTSYAGLSIKIPSCLQWWSEKGEQGQTVKLSYNASFIHEGVIVTKKLTLEVLPYIRIKAE